MDILLWKWKTQWKAAFIGTMIIGILCYFSFLSNHFITYDSMWNLYSDQDMISSGRQFLMYACSISSYYDLPALNGILSILYLAVVAVMMVEIFQIRSNLCAVLVGGFMVTFPSVISTFAYSFTVDGYMLAILLTTIGFYFADRFKYGFLAGAVLGGLGIGIYQAYFAYLIALCIVKLLLDLLDKDDVKTTVYKGIRFLCMGVLAYGFYALTLTMMLQLKGAELSGYQGTDKVLEFQLGNLVQGFRVAFDSFYQLAVWGNVFTTTVGMKIAYVCLGLLGAGLFLFLWVERRRHKDVARILLALLLIAALPFGLNVICILSPGTHMHLLIRYGWVMLFVLVLLLADRMSLNGKAKQWKTRAVALVALASVVMISQFIVVANIAAFNMEERYEKTYGLCLRLVDRLEQTEGYETGMKVAVLGGLPNGEKYPATDITGKDLSGYFGTTGEYAVNSTEKIAEFAAHYLNVTIQCISPEEEIALTQTREFQEMKNFPEKESLRKIGDVWVVRLNG